MDKEPLFSIIMATYNRAHLLPRAINSVLNQSYSRFELIIIDDASSDDTEDVCSSYKDDRIHHYRHTENKGVLAAKNWGMDIAQGEYITFVDDDDELLSDALETAAKYFVEFALKDIKIIWFDVLDVERKGRSGIGIKDEGYIQYRDLLCEKISGDFWLVIDKNALGETHRFDERLRGQESWLWLKLLRESNAYYIPKILYRAYRKHGERICRSSEPLQNIERRTLTHEVFVEQYGEEWRPLCPKVYGRKLAILGALQILNGNKAEGRRKCLESLKYTVAFDCFLVLILSFILKSHQIKSLASNYIKLFNR